MLATGPKSPQTPGNSPPYGFGTQAACSLLRFASEMRLLLAFFAITCLLGCSDTTTPEVTPGVSVDASGAVAKIAAKTRRGLWVLAEGSHRTLDEPARIDALVANAQRLGVTDLFVQVYRGGRSWFPSAQADDTPWQEIKARSGADPLKRLIDSAHAADLRVHAWFNCLSLAQNADAPMLAAVGRDAVLADRHGRNLLAYPAHDVPQPDRAHTQLGTPGIWLDPADPAVPAYLEATLSDLIAAAPGFDGLHLDFIRYPLALPITPGSRFIGLDFGYGPAAKRGYEAANGKFKRGDRWDQFRRDAVSAIVGRLKARIPEDWEQSAAVIAYADRAYLSALQDWRAWLDDGSLDFAVAMSYTRDDALFRYQTRSLRGGVGGERVWLGLGTWLFLKEPVRMNRQIELAEQVAPAGVVLFSYDAIADAEGVLESVRWSAPVVAAP